ncbi:glutamine amidotransferase [Alsobacter soli]|uniref:Glutamine amidotransferase n=1 Tax=Alsobacter soli TaxID=2109933 RepID=A0A2T1HZ30_9HYPH|nr:type 1 glutamine amidotransferase [Alsobacter soli]PSC06947.1 glutamine amidotransferase [Alsobacter soli]
MRFLVVEGNTRDARLAHRDSFGLTPSESYAAVLQSLEPQAVCDIAFPADEGANLPDGAGLESYDAVVLTGSHLNAYNVEPAVARQIAFARAAYASGTPFFGSCWGVQIGALAAGGDVRANPSGREIGFARRLAATDAGRSHPLLAGRPAAWDAPAVHLDAVTTLPDDVTVLASNALTPVQAAEIRHAGGTFWGVQYHPEFSLAELAAILRRYGRSMLAEGFFRTEAEHARYVDELEQLDRAPGRADLAWRHGLDAEVLDPERRLTEIRNFLDHRVKPERSRRGRA